MIWVLPPLAGFRSGELKSPSASATHLKG